MAREARAVQLTIRITLRHSKALRDAAEREFKSVADIVNRLLEDRWPRERIQVTATAARALRRASR